MTETAGIKVRKQRGYTVVYNDMLPAGQITARAWGIYVYLLSRPDGWETRVSHLQTVFSEGRDAIYTALRSLADLGLMTREEFIDNGLRRTRYVIDADQAETPGQAPDTDSQDTGNPEPGTPEPEKPGQVSKEVTTTESTNDPSLRSGSYDIDREDVERLCSHLADRIAANGSKRPTITKTWRQAARLMLDTDHRDEAKVHRAIEWCQDDEFWRANIMSMQSLRRQYDTLRLRAQESRGGNVANVHHLPTGNADRQRREQAFGA